MKPNNNAQNLARCICGRCPLCTYCNQIKEEKLFCARKASSCDMDGKEQCICGQCPVFLENDLAGGYFCIYPIRESFPEGENNWDVI